MLFIVVRFLIFIFEMKFESFLVDLFLPHAPRVNQLSTDRRMLGTVGNGWKWLCRNFFHDSSSPVLERSSGVGHSVCREVQQCL